jgi:hypothetical protein
MNWKRHMRRNFLFALVGGAAATAIYWGLLYTTALHGFGVKALGPANNIIWKLDPNCYMRSRCDLEELAVNVVLYVFWIFVALIGIDILRQIKRKVAG